ncbi:MAG: hypothetical protein HOV83_24020 [Catenulispora sp.]|nr:hypothetical protein [Catenulispora sp.]
MTFPANRRLVTEDSLAKGPAAALLTASYVQRLEPATYTYNADGAVATETVGGKTTTYTYNADGSVHTAARDGVTLTYSYNADGTVSGVA